MRKDDSKRRALRTTAINLDQRLAWDLSPFDVVERVAPKLRLVNRPCPGLGDHGALGVIRNTVFFELLLQSSIF